MPSFGGSSIFGTAVTMSVGDQPRAAQKNAYSGLNGVEHLDQGDRGRVTAVSGRFRVATADDLNSAEMSFRGFKDGNAYELVDMFGNSWQNVVLESFEPQGKVQQLAGGGWTRAYSATFQHLTDT